MIEWIFPLGVALAGLIYVAYTRILDKVGRASRPNSSFAARNSTKKRPSEISLDEHDRPDFFLMDDQDLVKDLYHKLQNLEDYPEALATGRNILFEALNLAEQIAKTPPQSSEIADVPTYSATALKIWSERQEKLMTEEFGAYIQRRRAGQSRELLPTHDEGVAWLCQQAPLRCVDGAWLSRLSQVRSPWQHMDVVRHLWQIFSEEYGDGDLRQHHTYIYQALLRQAIPGFPEAHSREFLDPKYGASDFRVWQYALLQLLISLFHEELLPEVLGFNLHFEAATLNMMKAAVEMKEVGLDPSYFRLHVSIDNGASGHTAMARNAVDQYLRVVEETQGTAAVQTEWKRVQVGYLLSKGNFHKQTPKYEGLQLAKTEAEIAKIFMSKATFAQAAHCSSSAKIKGRSLEEWLDPSRMENEDWRISLVRAMGSSAYWVKRGDPANSRFFKELLWGGKMFGAFTEVECIAVSRWIQLLGSVDDMKNINPPRYIDQTCPGPKTDNILNHSDGIERLRRLIMDDVPVKPVHSFHFVIHLDVHKWGTLLPAIWILHFCLLEQCTAIPSKSGTELGCTTIRILRAEWGFQTLQYSVAGTDGGDNKTAGTSRPPMERVTKQIMTHYHHPSMSSLQEVLSLQADDSLPAVMLQLSNAPEKAQGLLLGMASAFISLYHAMADCEFIDSESRDLIRRTAETKERELLHCQELLRADKTQHQHRDFCQGFHYIRRQLSR